MDSKLLPSRVSDAIRLCDSTAFPKFIGFLTPEETAVALAVAKKQNADTVCFGGYEAAERVFFGVFPEWCENREDYFPINPITFKYRAEDKLSHRSLLGTLMSLGIARETVGDILVGEGRTVVFLSQEIADFVFSQVEKVSGVGVRLEYGFKEPLPTMSGFKEINGTLASARLDCVIATLINTSRGKACELIEDRMVSVNSVCCEKAVKTVANGDKITVRGKGKFVIDSIDNRSKKDRLILKAKKFV